MNHDDHNQVVGELGSDSGGTQHTDRTARTTSADEIEPLASADDAPVDDSPTLTAEGVRTSVLADLHAYYDDAPLVEAFAPAPAPAFLDDHFFDFGFLDGATPVAHYWVNEPFAFVTVLYDPAAGEHRYHVSEPAIDEFEAYVRDDLMRALRSSLLYRDIGGDTDREAVFEREATAVISEHAATVDAGSLHKLLYYLMREFLCYGPIDALMRDPAIEDISCDGHGIPVFVYHSAHRDLETNVVFEADALTSFTIRLAQRADKQLSLSNPLADASLPDGSRVQLTLASDVSTRGSNFTIRKFSEVPYTPVDLVEWNTFSAEEMAYFWLAIENNRSLLFAGGTGSGKTTSMNAVSFFIPDKSKVVSIEDTREITLPHDNWIQSVTRDTFTADGRGEVSMYALLQAALRQRPEYLLVGEIRTEQRVALTFFHAIATGHTAYSTFHGDSVDGVLNRLRNQPLAVPEQMLEGLDIISIQKQVSMGDERVRRNVRITELDVDVAGAVSLTDVFARDPKADDHRPESTSAVLAEIAAERGWSDEELAAELDRRATVLRHMVDTGVRDYREVAATIQAYRKFPEAALASVAGDETESADEHDEADTATAFDDVLGEQTEPFDLSGLATFFDERPEGADE